MAVRKRADMFRCTVNTFIRLCEKAGRDMERGERERKVPRAREKRNAETTGRERGDGGSEG